MDTAVTDGAAGLRLDYAEVLLSRADFAGLWPRATGWLIRLALEHALDSLWARTCPDVARCSRRAQLLTLGVVVDVDTRYRVRGLWEVLSRAGHHHHYELSPTAAELRTWLAEARILVTRLAAAAAHAGRGRVPPG